MTLCVCITKDVKNRKLLTISWSVGFIFAVGGWLIGSKSKHNRPDDSVSGLFTDLHAYPVKHETLTFGAPQGSRNPLSPFQYQT